MDINVDTDIDMSLNINININMNINMIMTMKMHLYNYVYIDMGMDDICFSELGSHYGHGTGSTDNIFFITSFTVISLAFLCIVFISI
jgi:hypothetical protein